MDELQQVSVDGQPAVNDLITKLRDLVYRGHGFRAWQLVAESNDEVAFRWLKDHTGWFILDGDWVMLCGMPVACLMRVYETSTFRISVMPVITKTTWGWLNQMLFDAFKGWFCPVSASITEEGPALTFRSKPTYRLKKPFGAYVWSYYHRGEVEIIHPRTGRVATYKYAPDDNLEGLVDRLIEWVERDPDTLFAMFEAGVMPGVPALRQQLSEPGRNTLTNPARME